MEVTKSTVREAIDNQDLDFPEWEISSEDDFLISSIERKFQTTDMSASCNEVYNDQFISSTQSTETCSQNVENQGFSEFYKMENLSGAATKPELRDDFPTLECYKLGSYASNRGERISCSPYWIQGKRAKSNFQSQPCRISSSNNSDIAVSCISNHITNNVHLMPQNSNSCSIVKKFCDNQNDIAYECATRNQTICYKNPNIRILNDSLHTFQSKYFNNKSQNSSEYMLNISTHKIFNNQRLVVSAHDYSATQSDGTSNKVSSSSHETDILEDTTGYQRKITSSQENFDSQNMFILSQKILDSKKMIVSVQKNADCQNSSQENSDSQMITSSQENSDSQKMISSSQENSDSEKMITSSQENSDSEKMITSSQENSDGEKMITSSQENSDSQKMVTSSQEIIDSQKTITSSQENSASQNMITSSQENSDSQKMIISSQENSDSQKMITSSQENSDSQKMITSSQENSDIQKMITSSKENSDGQEMITSSQENSDSQKMIMSSQENSDHQTMIISSQEISDSQNMTTSSQYFDDQRIITSNQEILRDQKIVISTQESSGSRKTILSREDFDSQKITSTYEDFDSQKITSTYEDLDSSRRLMFGAKQLSETNNHARARKY